MATQTGKLTGTYTKEELAILIEMIAQSFEHKRLKEIDVSGFKDFLNFLDNLQKIDTVTYSLSEVYNQTQGLQNVHGMQKKLIDMPLQINSYSELDKIVAKWRFKIGH